jgi:transposase
VITGAGRRRRWSVDAKAAIVGESCEVGANVSEVARRHDVSPSLVFLWRRQARQANAPVMASRPEPVFVPLTIGNVEPEAERATSTIEIEVGDVRVRIMGRVELGAVRDVLLAVRAVRR